MWEVLTWTLFFFFYKPQLKEKWCSSPPGGQVSYLCWRSPALSLVQSQDRQCHLCGWSFESFFLGAWAKLNLICCQIVWWKGLRGTPSKWVKGHTSTAVDQYVKGFSKGSKWDSWITVWAYCCIVVSIISIWISLYYHACVYTYVKCVELISQAEKGRQPACLYLLQSVAAYWSC